MRNSKKKNEKISPEIVNHEKGITERLSDYLSIKFLENLYGNNTNKAVDTNEQKISEIKASPEAEERIRDEIVTEEIKKVPQSEIDKPETANVAEKALQELKEENDKMKEEIERFKRKKDIRSMQKQLALQKELDARALAPKKSAIWWTFLRYGASAAGYVAIYGTAAAIPIVTQLVVAGIQTATAATVSAMNVASEQTAAEIQRNAALNAANTQTEAARVSATTEQQGAFAEVGIELTGKKGESMIDALMRYGGAGIVGLGAAYQRHRIGNMVPRIGL